MEASEKIYSFPEFILSYVSLSVIAGLFTYKFLNSFLENILFPIIDLTILPDHKFIKLSSFYNSKKNLINPIPINNSENQYVIRYGLFIKDLILWIIFMIFLFMLYKISFKIK